ncbi:MAG: nitrate/sulfonate/bicarbonate ABC transporter ATP-binding protein [Acidimicrobiales bacterium]
MAQLNATLPEVEPGGTILAVSGVSKSFSSPDGSPLPVLDNINLELRRGEIVALLGKSGSGKSTLLRCIAGLIAPTSGEITYRGSPVTGANPGVSMVFQSFALLPWLTVLQNVEIGLEAKGVSHEERRRRALQAIDRIGLDGFESAYPKELSGGMRQRVGFARALVVEPDALLMDEPFSALDVLTAENLRSELLRLWQEPDFPTRSMLIVTHNIDEAVFLADRIFVLGTNPGRIRTEIECGLPRPRHHHDEACQALVDRIYSIMTAGDQRVPSHVWNEATRADASPTEMPIPAATVGGMAGLLEILAAVGGRDDLPMLAKRLSFDVEDLLPLVDAADLLGLAKVDGADIELTADGRSFVDADIDTSKAIFARQAKSNAPLVRAICKSLDATNDGTLGAGFFLNLLRRGYTEEEAQEQLDIAIDWGRYGELFEFDANSGQLKQDRASVVAVGSGGLPDS